MSTYVPKSADIKNKKWYVVDADGATLGRLATKVASYLRGKHKPTYTPSEDMGDYVIVINSAKVKVTGKKLHDKVYFHHTGWLGGGRYVTLENLMKKNPNRVIEYAVHGMLPKGPLGRQMYKKLFVYKDENHKHQAQKPVALKI